MRNYTEYERRRDQGLPTIILTAPSTSKVQNFTSELRASCASNSLHQCSINVLVSIILPLASVRHSSLLLSGPLLW